MTNETETLLRQALEALNTAPRFKVGNSDSYKVAAAIDAFFRERFTKATAEQAGVKRYAVQAYMLTGDEIQIEAADAEAARAAAAAHFETMYPNSTCEITQVDAVTG